MQSISPNYKMRKWSQTDKAIEENLSQSYILCQFLRTKTLTSRSKFIRQFYLFLPLLALYLLSGCDLFNMWCLSSIHLVASLDILCFKSFNLKNKIMKIEHKKIFCEPSKTLKNVPWPINMCLKYFMTPAKTLRPPLLHT